MASKADDLVFPKISAIAARALRDPESLTKEEIRALAAAALLKSGGLPPR